jgi:hypothetical protein
MSPSRLILTGTIMAVAGVVGQVSLGIVSARMMEGISSSVAAAGSLPDLEADWALDQIHRQTKLLLAAHWASWIVVALGLIVLAAGTYRNARATEALQRQISLG